MHELVTSAETGSVVDDSVRSSGRRRHGDIGGGVVGQGPIIAAEVCVLILLGPIIKTS